MIVRPEKLSWMIRTLEEIGADLSAENDSTKITIDDWAKIAVELQHCRMGGNLDDQCKTA